ncbi:MAG: phage coat protein [Gammaproteobacteria bacterium]
MGWLDDLTGWFIRIWRQIWDAVVGFFKDLIIYGVEAVIHAFAYIVSLIPVPSFLTTYTIGGLLGGAGPTIGWLCTQLQLGTALSMIAAAYAFRLFRKLITLGQW